MNSRKSNGKRPYFTDVEFISAWRQIRTETNNRIIQFNDTKQALTELTIYTHAGKETDVRSFQGLYLRYSELSIADIKNMPLLSWNDNATLNVVGCNTGYEINGMSPAKAFWLSQNQQVKTLGQSGYSYFSISSSEYWTIADLSSEELKSTRVYLRAFSRGKNDKNPIHRYFMKKATDDERPYMYQGTDYIPERIYEAQ